MNIKRLFLAVVSSLLLAAGLARAAESFDSVSTHAQVQSIQDSPPCPGCIILN